MKKISPEGEFLPFPGTTILSSVRDADLGLLREIQEELESDELIRQFFKVLPSENYHMTLTGLATQNEISDEAWKQVIDRDFENYQKINEYLKDFNLKPKVGVIGVGVSGAISVSLEISHDQKKILQTLLSNIPPLLVADNPIVVERTKFHMTLAYRYKEVTPEVLTEIQKRAEDIVNKYLKNKSEFTLGPAMLYFFRDMALFHCWDGTENPFIRLKTPRASTPHSQTFFSERDVDVDSIPYSESPSSQKK